MAKIQTVQAKIGFPPTQPPTERQSQIAVSFVKGLHSQGNVYIMPFLQFFNLIVVHLFKPLECGFKT